MPARWIVIAASLLVPPGQRAEWRAEWEAELAHYARVRSARRISTVRRSAGAVIDALWLQAGQWRSLRFLLRNYRVSATAILSLAVAIAATLVGLACWDAMLHRPPGVPDPGQLRSLHFATSDDPFGAISYEDFRTISTRTKAFTTITAYPYSVSSGLLDFHGRTERFVATEAVDNFFAALSIQPVLGTLSLPRDGGPSGDAVVISEPLWRRLGTDPAIVGKTVRINGHAATIVGVAPASFRGMLFVWNPDIWMSFAAAEAIFGNPPTQVTDRSQRWLHIVGRIAPGVTDAAAAAEVQNLVAAIHRQHPSELRQTVIVRPARTTPESERSWITAILATLVASVLLLLTVACVNVANLLLGLALSRRYEFSVRTAIGASRWHLILPQVRESLALAATAGIIGYGIARAGLVWLSSYRPSIGGFFPSPAIDFRPGVLVTVIATALITGCGLAIGLIVAWRSTSEGLSLAITHASTVTHTPRTRLRNGMVLVQMAVATLVLVALGVTVSSLARLQDAPLGFSSRHLGFIGVNLAETGYTEQTGPSFYERARDRLRSLPGVEAVSFVDSPPFLGGWGLDTVSPAEAPAGTPAVRGIRASVVDRQYFTTMGIDIGKGRAFEASDSASAPEVVIVNETMARRFWPGTDPIGRQLHIANHDRSVIVVGVAADGKYDDIDEAPAPFMYLALSQHYLPELTIVVRTTPKTAPAISTLVDRLRDIEPRLAVGNLGLMSLDQLLALPLFFSRAVAAMVGTVAGITLLLAIAGLYSSTFYSVHQRRQELTLRMLLGADVSNILGLALRSMATVAVTGAIVGLIAGGALLPLVSSLFFGIRPVEPLVILGVAAGALMLVVITTMTVVWPLARRGPSLQAMR
ncbi:MAG TPA: ABC transporter permease [Vicinamibacterales bacterium]|nr:ABC transporter permease [Vicinamibacterales bacterium]